MSVGEGGREGGRKRRSKRERERERNISCINSILKLTVYIV